MKLIEQNLDSMLAELSPLSSEQLRKQLADSLTITASSLLRLAAIMRVLEERGDDLSDLRFGLKAHLRKIAYGQLVPGAVVRFSEFPHLLQRVGNLPIPEQQRLAEGESVTVIGEDGKPEEKDPLALTYDQVRQVFARDHLRDSSEQIAAMANRNITKTPRLGRRYLVRVDKRNRSIFVGKAEVPISEVLTAMAEAAGWQGEILEDQHGLPTASAKLTEQEKERLKSLAKAMGVPEWEVVRRAILTWLV